MDGFFQSERFKSAVRNTLIGAVVFPALLTAFEAMSGQGMMSLEAVRSNVWPQAGIFAVVYGTLTIGLAMFLFKSDKRQ